MTDSLKLFELRARAIYRYACRYGVEHTPYEVNGERSPQAFVRTCYAGFVVAQHLIIDELITLHLRQRELTTQLSIARHKRDKAHESKIKRLLRTEKFKEQVIRKLADSIAWQLLRGQNYIARRLYIGEDSPPSIDKSNLASVVEVINELNAEDPLSFALISDTTSFIQVGDILRIHHNGLEIIEVKEGEKNSQAITILESLEESSEIDEKKLTDEHGQYLAKQITRMSRQQKRAQRAVNVLNTGSGPDTSTGIPIRVKDVEFPESKYFSDLKNLLEELNDKDWAYTIVDSVLHIGAYKGIFLGRGATTLGLAALAIEQEEYPVFTLRQGIIMPLAEPIFLKRFTEEQVFDIVFNRIEVHLLLSIEGIRKLFNEVGAETHWMSRRASAQARQSDPYNSFLVHNDRCLLVKSGSTQITVGDSLLGRIIFDSMRPKAVVVMFAHEESM